MRNKALYAIPVLVGHITLTSDPKRGEIAATLPGDLVTILEMVAQKQNTPGRAGSGVSGSEVAGARSPFCYNFGPQIPPLIG